MTGECHAAYVVFVSDLRKLRSEGLPHQGFQIVIIRVVERNIDLGVPGVVTGAMVKDEAIFLSCRHTVFFSEAREYPVGMPPVILRFVLQVFIAVEFGQGCHEIGEHIQTGGYDGTGRCIAGHGIALLSVSEISDFRHFHVPVWNPV